MGSSCRKEASEPLDLSMSLSYRAKLLHEHRVNRDVYKYYNPTKVLAGGSMGTVWYAKKKPRRGNMLESTLNVGRQRSKPSQVTEASSGDEHEGYVARCHRSMHQVQEHFALKVIRLDAVDSVLLQALKNEIDILKHLDHPNIVRMYQTFGNRHQIYIVMEYCSGGNLRDRQPYTEGQSAKITTRLLSAVQYMHKNNVVHRDLKMENVMFENQNSDAEIRVIDFGLSAKYMSSSEEEGRLTSQVGTYYTMAPEIFSGVYSSKVDLWSVGVIAYILLVNREPFAGSSNGTREELKQNIIKCNFNFNGEQWRSIISAEAKYFVSSLLQSDPERRPDASSAIESQWLRRHNRTIDIEPDPTMMHNVFENFMQHSNRTKFERLVRMIIAHKSPVESICELRDAFYKYDADGDGTISFKEFQIAAMKYQRTEEELKEIFENMDLNETGDLFYTEFLAGALTTRGNVDEERLADAFDRLDSDHSGKITKKNLNDFLGRRVCPEVIDEIMEEVDQDRDGAISLGDFLRAFQDEI